MKIICIFNQKGGVGKTTTNINLCAYLEMEGYKVLTIDIDPQGNTTSGFGLDKKNLEVSMYDVLTTDLSLKEVIVKSDLVQNLYVAPSTMDLAGAEVEMIGIPSRETILLNKVKEVKDEYDYIFIDCPPSLGVLTINALTCSDSVLIPIQCEYLDLEGVADLLKTIEKVKKNFNPTLKIKGICLTMFDGRSNLSKSVVQDVRSYFGSLVFDTIVPRNVRIPEAPSHGKPVMLYDFKSVGTQCYVRLAAEVLQREKEEITHG